MAGLQIRIYTAQYMSGAYDYMWIPGKVWNTRRKECLHSLFGHTIRVYSLQVWVVIPFAPL